MSGYYNRNNRGITKKLGPVTAYADAVLAGYTGTREQWAQDMAKLGQNVTQVAQNTKLTTELAEQTRVNTEQVAKDTADVRRLAEETSDNAVQVASNTAESNRLAEETKQAAAQAKVDAEYAGAAADNFRVDTTLSEEGKAAEAKTTGEKFAQLSEEIDDVDDAVGSKVTYAANNPKNGIYVIQYHFIPDHRYSLKNTSAASDLSAATRITSDGEDTEIITNVMTVNREIVFTPTIEAHYLRIYFTAENGSFEIVDLDGLCAVTANLKERADEADNSLREYHDALGLPYRNIVPKGKTAVFRYGVVKGRTYILENTTNETCTMNVYVGNSETVDNTHQVAESLYDGISTQFIAPIDAEYLYVYSAETDGAFVVYPVDGMSNRVRNNDNLWGLPYRDATSAGKTTVYKFPMVQGHTYKISNLSDATCTMNVYVGNSETVNTSNQVVKSLYKYYTAEFVAPIDAEYLYVYSTTDADFEIVDLDGYSYRLDEMLDVPAYYRGHIETKSNHINGLNDESGLNGDTFVFITDYHRQANAENSPSLIKYIIENTGARFVMFGGDTQDYESSIDGGIEQIQFFKQKFKYIWDRSYSIIGNHEFNPYTSDGEILPDYMLSVNQIYRMLLKNKENGYGEISEYGNYWFDNPVQKIRYFATTCDGYCNMEMDSVLWLLNRFKDVPDGYSIVVFSHLSYSNTPEDATKCYLTSGVQWIAEGLDAYNNRQTYVLTDQGVTYGTFDYSECAGDALCIIGGHTHFDMDSAQEDKIVPRAWQTGIPDIVVTATTTDAYFRQNKNINVLDRKPKTITEQAFDVIHIDTKNKTLIMSRIGAGTDRIFHLSPLTESVTLTTMLTGNITWVSTQPNVATVMNGVVSAVGIGRTRIIATDENGNTEAWTIRL